jgi:hypothetical protein
MSTERQIETAPPDESARSRDRAGDQRFLSHAVDAAIRAALRRADARRNEPEERTRTGLNTA